MKYSWRNVPRYIRYVLAQTVCLFLLMVLFRLIFYFFFIKTTITDPAIITKAWYLGLKFDLRLTLILIVPIGALAVIFRDRFFTRPVFRKISFTYFFIVYLLLTLVYILDLGHYDYLGLRLDPSIMRFLATGERMTNAQMVWQSYPVIRGTLAILVFMYLVYRLQRLLFNRFAQQPGRQLRNWPFTAYVVSMVLLIAAGIYGNVAYFPLRWSQAMFAKDNGVSSLALNPVLYFVSNLSVQSDTYDIAKTKQYYPYIAKYLGVDSTNAEQLNFVRTVPGVDKPRLNVILVMLESTGAAVTSMYNNPMQATPNMQRLAKNGVLFEDFFVPSISTARTVYSVTTGLPDIARTKTASRHPKMVDQRVIMDQFKGYQKYYMLGGNTNWANIRAVFTNNVDSIQIFEEGYYKSPKADVWGVSDYDLITEASAIFKKANDNKQPFVAFLQLADNHPPYTTTAGAGDFKKLTEKDIDMKLFKQSGFVSIDQFNALRYEDYNVGHLISMAEKDGYLDNTIFMMFGDHNCILNPYSFTPLPEYDMATGGVRVTCFMYSPKHLAPQRISEPGSLLDIYPTVAKMVGMPFKNYTMGTDLFDSTRTEKYAFITYMRNQQGYYAIYGKRYLYEINNNGKSTALYDLQGDPLKDVQLQQPDTARYMDNLTRGFYESTRYLMFNNKKN
ncbi:LTA synthase family protein [Chitinophaga defluvii]|uniref:Sulfatase-like hydrolase/transferase n=1 Tax=Chitinophaga defluvii TaxID=3163343 RepID=A0ABV2TDU0_9BACT